MDTITIAVKFKKRELGGRVYDVTGADFDTMKSAIKAAGGTFVGNRKYWLVTNEAKRSLAETFSVKFNDFTTEHLIARNPTKIGGEPYHHITVRARMNGDVIFTAMAATLAEAQAVVDKFIAAYGESDEAAERYLKDNNLL